MSDPSQRPAAGLTAARVLAPFAAGYFISYLFRSVNAVIAPDLSASLALDAASLGLLTSVYFLAFGLFQLPVGLLLDRYGPRRVEAALLLVAAAGAAAFATSDGLLGLGVGRALIGLGVSACLMAALKATTLWFAPQRVPAVNGLVMACGGLGALTATAPVEAALGLTDWRGVIGALAALTVLAAALIFFVVPERPGAPAGGGPKDLLRGLFGVYRSGFFWRVVPLIVVSQATYLSVQGLWQGPWLRDVAGLDRGAVAGQLLITAAAMVAGFLSVGGLASRLARAGVPLALTLALLTLLFMVAQLLLIVGPAAQYRWFWMLFGFCGSAGVLAFPLLSQHFSSALTGRVNTAANVLVFLAAFALQWAIGAALDRWPPAGDGYDPRGYAAAFGALLLAQGALFIWYLPLLRRARSAPSSPARRG